MKKSTIAQRLLHSTILAGAAVSLALPAMAQSGDEILITGSRIKREDLTAPSPVAQVDAVELSQINTVNTEDYLNDLPQLIPGFDNTSNNPGNGTATVSLRGLGTNRTLVLVDGKRFVGNGITQNVDLNNIPTALVQRVDVLTGGASAVYGSDAMAGVVNFITRKDFEGVELSSSYRMTDQSDGQILTTSATIGGNFDEGKGNATLSVSYTDRKALFQGDRDFSTDTLVDNGPGAPFGTGGSANVLGGFYRPPGGNFFDFTALGGDPAECSDPNQFCIGAYSDNGTIRPLFLGTPNDLYNYAPVNYLQIPQERYSFAGTANYDITDNVEFYAKTIFSATVVDAQLAPTPLGSTFNVDVNNPFLPADLATLFESNGLRGPDTDGDGAEEYSFQINRRFTETATRNSLRDTNTFQAVAGFTGDIWDGWTWDVSGQFGRSTVTQTQTGNLSYSALGDCILGGRCDVFNGDGSISAAAAAEISRTGVINTAIEQTQLIATLGGEFKNIQMPGASSPLATVFGVEYREEYALQQPDSVLGPDVAGFNQSVLVEGRYSVGEVFGEFELPLVNDTPFAKSISLNGAFRQSDYSTVGSVQSYAFGGDWEPNDQLRIRAQFQRAVRAPNISELFSSPSNGFPGVGDPCAGGANGFFTLLSTDQQASVTANCEANGVPSGSTPVAQINAQIETVFAGDPNGLQAEEADTVTFGAVWQPNFIDGLAVIVDYYKIDIANALGGPSAQQILDSCYVFGVSAACGFVDRSSAGTINMIGGSTAPNGEPVRVRNQTALVVEGIDYQIDYTWSPNWEHGDFSFNLTGTHTLESSAQGSPEIAVFDCVGLYSGVCGEPVPENKILASTSWSSGPLSMTARYTWIDEVAEANGVVYQALPSQRKVASIGSKGWLDLSGSYALNDTIQLSGGIRNLLDEDVPLLGDCCNAQANTWPSTYDPLGRQYFIGVKAKF